MRGIDSIPHTVGAKPAMVTNFNKNIGLRQYQIEALSDNSLLRVIIWPRKAGKSLFLGIEAQTIALDPESRSFAIFIHPDAQQAYSLLGQYLVDIDPSFYCNTTFRGLNVQELLPSLLGRRIKIYFSEPDYYPTGTKLFELLAEIQLAGLDLEQVTYIGTASKLGAGSRLAQTAELVPIVHSTHPRETNPDWLLEAQNIASLLNKQSFRTEYMGEH